MRTRRCQYCGRDKRAPQAIALNGHPTCKRCKIKRRRAYNRAWDRAHKPRQPCERCGGPKPPGRARRLCDDCRAPRYTCRCGAELSSSRRRSCDDCQAAARARKRARSRAWNMTHKDRMAAAQLRYAETHRDELCASTRRWYEAMRKDPVRLAHFRETQRMGRRLKLEREGRPFQPVPAEKYPAASSQWTLPGEPLRKVVADWLIEAESSQEELAKASHVSDRLIRRLIHEHGNISVAAADGLATAMGLHLDLIYPEM